jgi:hypothetical protein
MASFLAGMGGGYLKAREKTAQDERQAKQDAWQGELQGRQRSEWQEADNLKSDLKRAAEPVSTGSVVTDAAGSSAFTKDADAATMLADMSSAKNSGTATQNATRVVDSVYTDPAKADEATKLATTPEAQNTRIVDAYKRSGQADKALTMQAAMRQGELGDIQLANTKFQQRIGDWMGGGFDGFRDGLNGFEAGPFKGKKIDFSISADGKTRSVVAIGPDGQPQPTGLVVPNSNEGLYQLGYILDKSVTPEQRLKMHREEKKQDLEEQKVKLAEDKLVAQEKLWTWRMGGGTGSTGGGGGSSGGRAGGPQAAAAGLPSPMEGFDSKKANAIAMDQAVAELSQQGKNPPTGQEIAKRSIEIYRALESEFRATGESASLAGNFRALAGFAKTPEQLKAVISKAQAAGLTPEQMAAIDPRFAQLAQPAQQPGKTAANPFADGASVAAKPAPAAPTKPKTKAIEPQGPAEFQQFQQALQKGYQPAGRGNAVFGAGEILYVNPKTGDRKWASQLFTQFAQ